MATTRNRRAKQPPNPVETWKSIHGEVCANHNADIYLYSGAIDHTGCERLSEEVKAYRSSENVILLLTTKGGFPSAAYRIARTMQSNYSNFIICIPSYCKSAGTLIACGANRIIMADDSELGPLDVQVYKQDELGEYTSGLTPVQALQTLRIEAYKAFEYYFLSTRLRSRLQISTRLAALIATRLVSGTFAPIYRQIDPMRLGEIQRAATIAMHYGLRLDKGNLKEDALEYLIGGYPSHDFVIDRQEASHLFNSIRPPTDEELILAKFLWPLLKDEPDDEEAQIGFVSKDFPATLKKPDGGANDREESSTGPAAPPPGPDGRKPAGKGGAKSTGHRGRVEKTQRGSENGAK